MESWRIEFEVHVRRAEWMASELFEQFAYRPVVRNGVGNRTDSLKPELSLAVSSQNASTVWTRSVIILCIIVSRLVSLPCNLVSATLIVS